MGKSWDQYRLGEPCEAPRRKGLKTLAIVAALLAITILPAMAAKGGGGGSATHGGGKGGGTGGSTSGGSGLAWKMITDADGNGPSWGDQLTFTFTTTPTSRPFVALDCYQGGARVYGFSAGIFPDYLFINTYTLKSASWTGGSANCTAQAYYTTSNGREVIFDRLDFTATA